MRKIAGIVLVVLMFNLLSVNVQAQPTTNNAAIVQNIENSALGLQSIESQEIECKDYKVTINVDSEKGKDISELKLFANVATGKGGGGYFEFEIFDSFELNLKKIDNSKFQADLLQEQIGSMASIWVNKIEITYNDGSKKT